MTTAKPGARGHCEWCDNWNRSGSCPGLPQPAPDDRCGCTFRFNDDGSFVPLTECTYHIERMKASPACPKCAATSDRLALAEVILGKPLDAACGVEDTIHKLHAPTSRASRVSASMVQMEGEVPVENRDSGRAASTVAGRASDGPEQPLSAAGRGAVVDEPCSTPPHATRMPPDEPSRGDRAVQVTTPAAAPRSEGGVIGKNISERLNHPVQTAAAAPPHASAGEKGGKPVFVVRREPGPQLTGVDDNMPAGAIHFVPDPHAACVPREKVERLVKLVVHRGHCQAHRDGYPCTCGLDAAIRECNL